MDENALLKLGLEPAPVGSLRSAIGQQLYRDANLFSHGIEA